MRIRNFFMNPQTANATNRSAKPERACYRPPLQDQVDRISENCTRCPTCVKECAFLKQNGSPGFIAQNFDPENPAWLTLAFDCSLCGLCAAVCPVKLSPADMFLEMRREAVDRGIAPLPGHKGIMAYEQRGISTQYSWYSLPDGCETILFPGCTFAGTRMDTTIALYEHLKQTIPNLGIVLDCCCKPSHDLGRDDFFQTMFNELRDYLLAHGIKTVIVVCPNCYKVFKTNADSLSVTTAYELLASNCAPNNEWADCETQPLSFDFSAIAIHDPCVIRDEKMIQDAVRKLAVNAGFEIHEMSHNRKKTICCGEGGSVGHVNFELSNGWRMLRKNEAKDRRLLTYCAGCAGFLNRNTPTDHILDAIYYPDDVTAGKRKAAKAPLTYFNRIRLKRYLQKNHPSAVTRERTFIPRSRVEAATRSAQSRKIKLIILVIMIAAIASLRFSGILENFDSETLRKSVASLGPLAPLAFILLYTVAPTLFLPGLPLTITGGILFGPVWGVVYSITGATFGACLAFLVSRYIARDWITSKLTGLRWQRLDRSVAKNGWKIVAFTRLVPLFPFNLLNYAFGLTPIRFLSYTVTSFISMLPACIAFIVFSSSLLDLLKGNISPAFIIGLLLIILVSLVPIILRKLKTSEAKELGLFK